MQRRCKKSFFCLRFVLVLGFVYCNPLGFAMIAMNSVFAIDYEDLAKVVEKLETKMEVKRKGFLNFLEQGISKMKTRKNLSPTEKRDLIEEAQKEISDFRSTNELPDHPGLINYSFNFAKETQSIVQEAETLRQKIVAESLQQSGLMQQSYKALESRIDAIISGSAPWIEGEQWKGTRTSVDGSSFGLLLTIDKVTGNSIDGRLAQTDANGKRDVMIIVGSRRGSIVHLETTEMKVGASRKLIFDGYVVGDNLIATISGKTAAGKPADGMILLHP